jgi:glucosamine--fructose-6-phosphate aminotransferase (isomerizing)
VSVSILQSEIAEQPAAMERLIAAESASVRSLASALRQQRVTHVQIVARGSSDNAARYAQYLFGTALGLPVALATPSLHTRYAAKMRFEDTLSIGISQSGQSPDICAVLEDAARAGAPTVAITNDPESPLARAASHVIPLHVGKERSVAATKSYTGQLLALALLILSMAEDLAGLDALARIPEAMHATLSTGPRMDEVAQAMRDATAMVTIGRGYGFATAWEIAQKVKELTYIPTEPYSAADFQHGPIAMIDAGFPVLLIAPQGAVASDLAGMASKLQDRGALLATISDVPEILAASNLPISLPVSVDERLSPLTSVIPGQYLSYALAHARGIDPEKPRGLNKVTETR